MKELEAFLQRSAEAERLEPKEEPRRCPICGSIDISAAGTCRHCGANIETEDVYEKCNG